MSSDVLLLMHITLYTCVIWQLWGHTKKDVDGERGMWAVDQSVSISNILATYTHGLGTMKICFQVIIPINRKMTSVGSLCACV